MSFHAFLQRYQARHPFARDFVADALDDRDFPQTLASAQDLEHYLSDCHACPEAREGARMVWRRYQRRAR